MVGAGLSTVMLNTRGPGRRLAYAAINPVERCTGFEHDLQSLIDPDAERSMLVPVPRGSSNPDASAPRRLR